MEESVRCRTPGFCAFCGSVLPLLSEKRGVKCYTCHREFGAEVFKNATKIEYTIHFNSKQAFGSSSKTDSEGPIVERTCPKCNNDKMSYATLQLRSADEGQTVFYTCTECKYKETENS